MTGSRVEHAEALAASGQVKAGLRLLLNDARGGDVDALYRLAVWHLVGTWVPRDLAAAHELLSRAEAIGHVDAALMRIALTSNGSGCPADWTAAVAMLCKAASHDPLAAEHLALVNAMTIDAGGASTAILKGERLAGVLDVRLFRELLTPAECAHIANVAHGMLEPARVVDPATGRFVEDPVRTSHAAVIGPASETLVIQAINRRLATASGTAVVQGEPLTVLHYAPGQQYRMHHDALEQGAMRGNQRNLTMLLYLNDAYEGGATHFPSSGLTVKGKPGDVLLFANLKPDGTPDLAARHAGLPVTRGAKWMATRWIRLTPYDPWQSHGS